MPLRHLAGNCSNGLNCPTVYVREDGSVIVQGYTAGAADELDLPPGEGAVAIPRAVLLAAAEALQAHP